MKKTSRKTTKRLTNMSDIIRNKPKRPCKVFDYKILSSGSAGNCVIINDVMLDCGVPYKTLEPYLKDIKYLLITHIHGDHVKKSTLDRIKKHYPDIKIIGNYEVYQKFGTDIISNGGFKVITDDYEFIPFEGVHDVLVHGYTWNWNGKEIIYITDTASLDKAPKKKYDYLFLESNHCEKKIEKAREEGNEYGYNPYKSSMRHLSKQNAKKFYYFNRVNSDSKLIELHKSKKFY